MCPRRVCVVCGVPSRRIVEVSNLIDSKPMEDFPEDYTPQKRSGWSEFSSNPHIKGVQTKLHIDKNRLTQARRHLGWSDCGHNNWRPGRILDPFVGSGTTLAVASGMGRDSVGIDLDGRNAHLAEQRVGMFLEVDWGDQEPTTELPPEPEIIDVEMPT
jgi:DNA modification methylase